MMYNPLDNFYAILNKAEQSSEQFPVDFDEVWDDGADYREIQRQHFLDRIENLGVKLEQFLLNYCLSVSLSRLSDALSCLEQQIENKRIAKHEARKRGEKGIDKNPRYQVGDPTNFLIKALDNGWKPNRKSDSSLQNGSWREMDSNQLKSLMKPSDIKIKYPFHQWEDIATHFGYSLDEIINAAADSPPKKSSIFDIFRRYDL